MTEGKDRTWILDGIPGLQGDLTLFPLQPLDFPIVWADKFAYYKDHFELGFLLLAAESILSDGKF